MQRAEGDRGEPCVTRLGRSTGEAGILPLKPPALRGHSLVPQLDFGKRLNLGAGGLSRQLDGAHTDLFEAVCVHH